MVVGATEFTRHQKGGKGQSGDGAESVHLFVVLWCCSHGHHSQKIPRPVKSKGLTAPFDSRLAPGVRRLRQSRMVHSRERTERRIERSE